MLHTDTPALAEIAALASERSAGSVSIYLKTGRMPDQAEQARARLRNFVDAATEQLAEAGAGAGEVEALAEAVAELIDDRAFWSYQSETLVLFGSSGRLTTYRIANRLPELLEVADRYLVKPLLRTVTFPQTAFVLALSQNYVRLIEATADGTAFAVDVPGLPSDAASAVGLPSISGRAPDGRVQGSEGRKVRLGEYCRAVEVELRAVVNRSGIPLILAATQPIDGIYRAVNTYPHLLDESIRGNADEISDNELSAAARPILDALYAQQLGEVRDELQARRAQGRAVTDLSDIARAATFGAIDTLLFDFELVVPGTIDEQSGAVQFDDGQTATNYGVVDEIARRALLTGATIYAVRADDLPEGVSTLASVRFPV
ncbi:hypothetical protein [Conyzicola sp.]|uniref:baeRF11 domain-containing protein n=1 Tax=Conyzicola sp. TaxID=1969404 RepID=UPI003989CB93